MELRMYIFAVLGLPVTPFSNTYGKLIERMSGSSSQDIRFIPSIGSIVVIEVQIGCLRLSCFNHLPIQPSYSPTHH